jgi:hypothetical protein
LNTPQIGKWPKSAVARRHTKKRFCLTFFIGLRNCYFQFFTEKKRYSDRYGKKQRHYYDALNRCLDQQAFLSGFVCFINKINENFPLLINILACFSNFILVFNSREGAKIF